MTRRSRDWNEGLARELRNPEFAREFVLALLDEGFSLQQALAKTIRTYGIKEFAELAGIPRSNISRAIREGYSPGLLMLEKLLKPLGLRLAAMPSDKEGKDQAA
jgi:DNA-binding phage protein